MRLAPRLLDETRFARYGTVVPRPMSAGRTPLDDVLGCTHPDGRIRASITRVDPAPLPISLPRMERHPNAVQLFLPLSGSQYLAVTGLGADAPDMATLETWIVPGDLGITYGIGVWHVPIIVLSAPATFLVLMHRISPGLDEEWYTLSKPLEVTGPDASGA